MIITDIKAANAAAGFFFFSKDTMRFFSSKVESKVYEGPGGVYFVTSEQMGEEGPRKYRVRRFEPETGRIVPPPGERFMEYATKESARECAKALAKGE